MPFGPYNVRPEEHPINDTLAQAARIVDLARTRGSAPRLPVGAAVMAMVKVATVAAAGKRTDKWEQWSCEKEQEFSAGRLNEVLQQEVIACTPANILAPFPSSSLLEGAIICYPCEVGNRRCAPPAFASTGWPMVRGYSKEV